VIDRVARQLGDGARTDSRLAIFKRAEHELNYYPSLPPPARHRAGRAVDITADVSRATRSARKSLPRMCSRFASKDRQRNRKEPICGSRSKDSEGNFGNSLREENGKFGKRGESQVSHVEYAWTCGGPFSFPPSPCPSELAEVRLRSTVSRRPGGRRVKHFAIVIPLAR